MTGIFCYFKVSALKHKVRKNPLLGEPDGQGNYVYRQQGFVLGYRIIEGAGSRDCLKWLFIKRHKTFFEKESSKAKGIVADFFRYQKWPVLFRPLIFVPLAISLLIIYGGLMDYSRSQFLYMRWIVSRITGISAESITQTSEGDIRIQGQRQVSSSQADPVTITFNPWKSLFGAKSAEVHIWSGKQKRYVNYQVSVGNEGDVWMGRSGAGVHGKFSGQEIIWDRPQFVGKARGAFGHRVEIDSGKLKIIDE